MQHEVVVVGGGIGGLTVAALLAARGIGVCLLERNSSVGGCVSRVEYLDHDFEPGMGIYTSWGAGEIHERVFSELPVTIPETRVVETDYVIRLSDAIDVRLRKNRSEFADELRIAFPECADAAIRFYELLDDNVQLSQARATTVLEHAAPASERFQQFIDAQLQAFIQIPIDRCSLRAASEVLSWPRQTRYSIVGGPATVAERLAESIKASGGTVRLDSPVLRLAYSGTGEAIGVDLLSGERVLAKRAIVSNMTIWDTYGKLVGLNKTPPQIKKMLAEQSSRGAYVVYASMEQSASERLPGDAFTVRSRGLDDAPTTYATSAPGQKAPSGKLGITLKTPTAVDEWFAYQSSEEDYEEWDQSALERVWTQFHEAVPQIGADIEVVETASPRTYYDQTRRKLGMVLGADGSTFEHSTTLPNVFMVGDTVATVPTLEAVTRSAEQLATKLK